MKHYIRYIFFFFLVWTYTHPSTLTIPQLTTLDIIDRKLTEEEVKKRGIDVLVTEVIENIDEIDLRKMARSAIFETSYGFRWKMINVQTGGMIIIKVNKNFKLIAARKSKKSKKSSTP